MEGGNRSALVYWGFGGAGLAALLLVTAALLTARAPGPARDGEKPLAAPVASATPSDAKARPVRAPEAPAKPSDDARAKSAAPVATKPIEPNAPAQDDLATLLSKQPATDSKSTDTPRPPSPEPSAIPSATPDPIVEPAQPPAVVDPPKMLGEKEREPAAKPVANEGEAPKGYESTFMGSTGYGEHFCIIADVSGSMVGRPIEFLKTELIRTLGRFNPKVKFSIFLYSSTDIPLTGDQWQLATKANVDKVVAVVRRIGPGGGTNPSSAFSKAFELNPRPDLIFFMTDGLIPSNVPLQVAALNASGSKVKINSIEFSLVAANPGILKMKLADKTNPLRKLAEDSSGSLHIFGAGTLSFAKAPATTDDYMNLVRQRTVTGTVLVEGNSVKLRANGKEYELEIVGKAPFRKKNAPRVMIDAKGKKTFPHPFADGLPGHVARREDFDGEVSATLTMGAMKDGQATVTLLLLNN